jgi:drug/metabolite transporter (DMT)-like permease
MLGFASALLAHALLMLMTACGKLAFAFHDPVEMTFYRCLISVMACFVLMAWRGDWKHIIPVDSPKLVAGRSVLGTINIVLLFYGYTLLPLADATALSFTASLITPVLAYYILKEDLSRSRLIAIGLGFIGVLIMAGPAGQGSLLGLAVMSVWVLINAANGVILRKVSRVEHPITILLWLFMVGLVGTGVMMPAFANPLTPYSAFLLITAGLCGFGGQWLYTMSYKFAEASTVAVLNYSAIIWAALYGYILFQKVPEWQLLLGAAIVIGVNIWLFFVQSAQARRAAIVADIKDPPSV